ncbi:MAG: DUF2953 domain-containing protein [Limnochordia bacterium]
MLLGLFLFLALLMLLLLVSFSVELELSASEAEFRPVLRVGIGRWRAAVPRTVLAKAEDAMRQRAQGGLREMWGRFTTGLRVMDHLLQEVELLHFEVWFGFHDAFWTALGCGGLWTLLGSFTSMLSTKPRFRQDPEIHVHPVFEGTRLEVRLHCIFHFRVGQIIVSEIKRWGQAWLV